MRDRHTVVKKQCRDQGRPHPGILRVRLRRFKYRRIGINDRIVQAAQGKCPVPRPVRRFGWPPGQRRLDFGTKAGGSHAARHLTGVVAAHAVGEDGQAQPGIGKNSIARCASG